jgi:hypothetical protein
LNAFGSRKTLLLVLLAGLALRLALLWMPGTEDMYYFRMWGALALRSGLVNVYTWKDHDTLSAIFMKLQGVEVRRRTTVATDLGPALGVPDYPPGNILFLELSAALCRYLQGGVLQAGYLLNACLNLWPLLFTMASALALWLWARRENAPRPLEMVASFWLNPALILTAPLLGYQDPIFAFFGLMALLCFYQAKHSLSVLFLALSCLTKPQGVFIVPVLAAAFWAEGGWRLLYRCSARFLFFFLVPLLPYIVSGRLLAPVAAILRGAIYPALSAQTANIWWLIGPAVQAAEDRSMAPWLGIIDMVPQSEFRALAGYDPIWLSLTALLVFTAINLRWLVTQLRHGERRAIFWAAALQVYGYTMLALFVHENHLFAFLVYSAPLLAVPVGLYRRAYWGLSVIYALNLYLFDGFGQGIEAFHHWVRSLFVVDLTVLVSLANVGIFIMLVRITYGRAGSANRRI